MAGRQTEQTTGHRAQGVGQWSCFRELIACQALGTAAAGPPRAPVATVALPSYSVIPPSSGTVIERSKASHKKKKKHHRYRHSAPSSDRYLNFSGGVSTRLAGARWNPQNVLPQRGLAHRARASPPVLHGAGIKIASSMPVPVGQGKTVST